MPERYPLLFSPITVGGLELKNRVVMPAMLLNYSERGGINDTTLEFYRRRAQGGTGLIMVGGCPVGPLAGRPSMISLRDDADAKGLRRLTTALHEAGARAGAQLFHGGAYTGKRELGAQAVSSSPHTSRFTREECRSLSLAEIGRVQKDFADAALRAKESGFDMVEVLASAGYLICQFLSPRINRREDDYGGSLDNRMRFGLEVVQTVRKAVGSDFCVGVRVSGNDFVPGSHTNREAAGFAAACVQAGADMINVTGGWHETKVPQLTGELPRAGFSYLARGVRDAARVPVACSNRINLPDAAEEVLARGDADLICLARPLIADPDWPQKAQADKPGLIRPCIACNQGCFDSLFQGGAVGCSVNPRAGHEYLPRPRRAAKAERVLVIGGGPAGCSAALASAARGHEVSLWEAGSALGGQPLWYGAPLGKPDFALLGPHYEAALKEAGVEVKPNLTADAALIQNAGPDRVILATGARPSCTPIPGADLDHVCTAWQIIKGERRALKHVVVVGGGAVGVETAIYLARSGALSPEQAHFMALFESEAFETMQTLLTRGSRQVTLVEMLPKLGRDIGRSTRWIAFLLLKRYGIQTMTNTEVRAIEPGRVLLDSRGERKTIKADSVVLAAGAKPQDSLYEELIKYNIKVDKVGDAALIGDLGAAVKSGYELGNSF